MPSYNPLRKTFQAIDIVSKQIPCVIRRGVWARPEARVGPIVAIDIKRIVHNGPIWDGSSPYVVCFIWFHVGRNGGKKEREKSRNRGPKCVRDSFLTTFLSGGGEEEKKKQADKKEIHTYR